MTGSGVDMTRPAHRGLGLGPRLALVIAAMTVLIAGGVAWILLDVQEENLFREAVHGAERFSETLKRTAHLAMMRNQREDLQSIISEASGVEAVETVRVINKAGLVTYSSRPAEVGSRVDLEAEACIICHARGQPLVAPLSHERVRIFRSGSSTGRVMGYITPIYNESRCGVSRCHAPVERQKVLGVIDVQLSLAEIDEAARKERTRISALIAIGAVFFAVLGGWAGTLLVTRPVRTLAQACREISGRSDEEALPRIRPVGVDELEELVRSFNAMIERVTEARENLERKVEERTKQLRDAEDHLVRTEKMAAMGVMAAGIAHEINNPLTGIITFAHVLMRKAEPGGEEVTRLKRIVEEAERCSRIVGNLLSLARPADRVRRLVSLRAALGATLELLRPQPAFRGVDVRLKEDPAASELRVDGGGLHQVLVNLMNNAADAGAGRVEIETRLLASNTDRRVEIAVSDDGAGIAEEHRKQVFDPFFTTKEVGKGTGLGLWVCYRIVAEMGGRIEIAPSRGRGTKFLIELPENVETNEADGGTAAPPK